MLRRDIELLQKGFITRPSKLDPADILTFQSDDLRIIRTPQVGKLGFPLLINPAHPGNGEGFDGFEIKVERKGVVVRTSGSQINHHRGLKLIEGGDPTDTARQEQLKRHVGHPRSYHNQSVLG
jgi:hypothetical protein